MKRLIAILMALCMLVCFAACGSKTSEDPSSVPEETTSETWKTKSANYKFNDSIKLVFFQGYIKFNADNDKVPFPDYGDPLTPTEMTIAGEKVDAYSLEALAKIWSAKPTADLKVVDYAGKEYTMPAADLAKAYVGEYDEMGDLNGQEYLALSHGALKAGSLEVKDVKYIISESKDVFMFPQSGMDASKNQLKLVDIFEEIGWDSDLVYRFVCFDGFWNYIDSQESPASGGEEDGATVLADTVICPLGSGGLNASIPFLTRGGAGKMNDIFFVAVSEIIK